MVDNSPILVTGATGNIGQHLVPRLSQQADVVAAVTRTSKARIFESLGVRTAVIDFADPHSLIRVMRDVGRVFLLVPFDARMGEWVKNSVNAACEAGVDHIVRLSGFGADADSPVFLNRIQGEIDRIVETSGLPFTLLRPNAFMQNFSVYHAPMIRLGGTLYLPDGDGRTSYVDARDIASVAAEVLLDRRSYDKLKLDITGAEALSGDEAADAISAAAGRPVSYCAVDDAAARSGMRGMPDWNIEALLSLGEFVRDGGAAHIHTAVKAVTGREPIGFDQFARDYSEVWKSSGPDK